MKSKAKFDYAKLVKEIFEEQNKVRQNPASYIPYLEEELKHFKGDVLYLPGEIGLKTNEGQKAWKEAIAFLKKQKPVDALKLDKNLAKAAHDHVQDLGPQGLTGHEGTDGSGPSERIERYAKWTGGMSENIDFGGKTGKAVLISLIVDDGVSTRGHRNNVFNNKMNHTGIASGEHAEYGVVSVIDYVEEWDDDEVGTTSKKLENVKIASNNKNVSNPVDKSDKIKGLFNKLDQKVTPAKESSKPAAKAPSKEEEYDIENDPDWPDGAVNVSIQTKVKTQGNKKTTIVTKTYTMGDGSKEVVESTKIE